MFFRPLKYYYLKFIRLKGTPKALALGTAIGVFIGLTPTIPFHTVLILALTFLTKSSGIAGIITSWIVCNPVTYLPIYYIALKIGNFVTPYTLSWHHIKRLVFAFSQHHSFIEACHKIAELGSEAIIVLLSGGILFALPFSIIAYYAAFHLFSKIDRRRKLRRERREQQLQAAGKDNETDSKRISQTK